MNIDGMIEVLQAQKAGRSIQSSPKIRASNKEWATKTVGAFNFQDYDYRLAPDVVYKIEHRDGATSYGIARPDPTVCGKFTKGYWKEGEL